MRRQRHDLATTRAAAAHLPLVTTRATNHPALIPHEVPAGARKRRAIPAKRGAKRPARAGNPRLSPPRPEASRPACHAGGRGSRPVAPVENMLQIGVFCCLFWRNRPPAFRPVTHSSRTRIRTPPDSVKPCKSPCSVAGHGVRVLGHPAAIPQVNRPAVLGGPITNGLKCRVALAGVASPPNFQEE